MGYSQHSGIVIVCDGTEAADKRIARVLWNDPATGVMRPADAGYEIAKACAKEQGLKLPIPCLVVHYGNAVYSNFAERTLPMFLFIEFPVFPLYVPHYLTPAK